MDVACGANHGVATWGDFGDSRSGDFECSASHGSERDCSAGKLQWHYLAGGGARATRTWTAGGGCPHTNSRDRMVRTAVSVSETPPAGRDPAQAGRAGHRGRNPP